MEITDTWSKGVIERAKGRLEGADPSAFAWVFVEKLDRDDMRAKVSFGGSLNSRASRPSEVAKVLENALRERLCPGIVIACDAHAEGNEPPEGASWDEETRRRGALMGDFAWATMLIMRSPNLRRKFLGRYPEKKTLVFAVTGADAVEVFTAEAASAIERIRDAAPKDYSWR